ncbi:hypothetical protein [Bradyrhizobium sp. McL0615]
MTMNRHAVSAALAIGSAAIALNGQSAWVWAWFLLGAVVVSRG